MSFVIATPEMLTTAATDLAKIGSTITAANTAAAAVAKVLPASADEVSVAVAALFGTHAQEYQTVSAQVATFHDRFVQTLSAAASSYVAAEAVNVEQSLLAGQCAHPGAVRTPADRQRRRRLPRDRAGRRARRHLVRQRRQRRVWGARTTRRGRRGGGPNR